MDNFNFLRADLNLFEHSTDLHVGFPVGVEDFLSDLIGDEFDLKYFAFRRDVANSFSVFFNYIIDSLESNDISYSEFLNKIRSDIYGS